MGIVKKKPKPIKVKFLGSGLLQNSARVQTKDFPYSFSGGVPVPVVGIEAYESVVNPRTGLTEEKFVGYDDADIDFFQRKAANNPNLWEIVEPKPKKSAKKAKKEKPEEKAPPDEETPPDEDAPPDEDEAETPTPPDEGG